MGGWVCVSHCPLPLLPLSLQSPATSVQPRGKLKPPHLVLSLVLPLLPASSEVQSRWQISTRASLIGRKEPSPAVRVVISCFSTFAVPLWVGLFFPLADGGLGFSSLLSLSKPLRALILPCHAPQRAFAWPAVNGHFLGSMKGQLAGS